MSNRIEITDFTAPELDVYARIPEVQLLRFYEPKPGLFIAESPKVIQRAANAGYQPVSFLVQHKDLEKEGKETGLPEDLLYTINGDNQKLLSYLEKNDPSSKQVLLQAVAHCNVDVWKKLKEKGCDLAIKGPDKRTLLHIAASYNDADIVKFLAKKEDLKKKTEEQM